MAQNETIRKIEYWTGKLLWFLAIGAGILSYVGMLYVALDAGFGLWLSWLWPLVTESAVVIFSLVLLNSKLNGYQNRWLIPIILLCTGLSSFFNMYHAPKPDLFTKVVWALPPIFLFAAFKTWIWKIEQDVKRFGLIQTQDQLSNEVSKQQNQLKKLTDKLNQTQLLIDSQPDMTDKEMRKIKLVEYLKDNPQATQEDMVSVIGVTRPTISTYLAELDYHKNGQGWQRGN